MTAILKNIKKEAILEAIYEIDLGGVPQKYQSKDYDVIHNQKHYPPKYVVLLANNNHSNNNKLTPDDFTAKAAKEFLEDMGFPVKKRGEIKDNKPVTTIIFPKLNDMPLEELAQIYRDIEDGKNVKDPINVPSDCNVIPSSIKGDCKDKLIGYIFDKRDFERRMPEILAHYIRCQFRNKNKKVILAVGYWDGTSWEITWKKPFEAVGGEVYRQMHDGKPERII
ncbi:MAG: hypothetical protein WA130_03725 [Candidatus Methanoperedens sp.]